MKLLREVITHSAFAVSLFVRKKNKLPITTRTVSDLNEWGIPSFAHDYLQTGYSYMLSISYLFINNTLKCNKAKIFPFNQSWLISTKNVIVKYIHIDIIAPNFTNFNRRIVKIFKIMFFMNGTQKKWNCWGKLLHTQPLL
jgi:hypothetical protein